VQSRDPQVIAGCHTPTIGRDKMDEAFDLIRNLPFGAAPPQPVHADLEALIHAIATGQQYAWQPPVQPA
jgi:hypothetical protein